MPVLWIIIAVILLVALFGGGWGYRSYDRGYWPFGPFLLLLIIVIILIAVGILR